MLDFTKPPAQGGAPYVNPAPGVAALTSEAAFFMRVYVWMFAGLLTTTAVSLILSQSLAWLRLVYSSKFVFLAIFGIQIGLVLVISRLRDTLAPAALKALFLVYAASFGLTVSLLIRVYPGAAFFKAFLSCTSIYGAMAVYGLVTKRSLQGLGSFLFMGLVGLIIASLVNFFVASSAMDFVICVVGVLIFAGLTAYDHQKLRVIHAGGFADSDGETRSVISGALELYLDFINLFLFLLRLFGRD
jgi:FtsH-binding integral membrane protein